MSFHLRPPSIDKGVSAFLWALGFFLYLWLGMLAVDVPGVKAFVVSALAGALIFAFVRVGSEENPMWERPWAYIP
jgi:hypothetical protein